MLGYPPPQKKGPLFWIFLTKHFCNAPTCSFHHNLFLVDLVTVAQRSKPSKCSTIHPKKKAHCLRIFLTKNFCNAPACSFHQNLFLVELVTIAQRSRPSKCARLSARLHTGTKTQKQQER